MYTVELYQINIADNQFEKVDIIDTYQDLEYMNRMNGIGAASFTMSIVDPKATMESISRFKTQVVIKRDGYIVWFGPITKISGGFRDTDGELIIQANSYLYHLSTRYTALTRIFTSTDQSQILWTLIDESQNQTNGTLLITPGSLPSTKNRDRTYEYGKISDLVINMSNIIDGINFSLDPIVDTYNDLTGVRFNTYASLGYARDDLPALELGNNVESVRFNTAGDLINQVTALGAGTGTDVLTASASSMNSQLSYSKREDILAEKDISIMTTLQDKANFWNNQYSVENYDIEVSLIPGKNPQYNDISLGDYLNLDIVHGYMNFGYQLRVTEVEVQYTKDGKEIVKPKLKIL